nr:hypothetical protein [Tanacetum cinerariifolium]
MKSSTTNVETSINEEVFHEVSESFQGESSLSSLNDDVQQSPEEVIIPHTNTQSISINMIPNGDEASTSHNVFNERLKDAYFDASTLFHDPSNVHTYYQPYPHEKNAMQEELDQFARLKVWGLVPRPEGFHRLSNGCKDSVSQWILKEEVYVGQPSVPTPMVEQAKLKLDLVRKPVDHTNYRSMIGSLMYVTSDIHSKGFILAYVNGAT